MAKVLNLAHRGFSGNYPENTMLAIEKAVTEGSCDGLEIDVQLSSDSEPIVIHDETVNRVSDGIGHVSAFTLRGLRSLDVGSHFSHNYTGQRIPHLTEVLDFAKQHGLLLNIELKNSVLPYLGMERIVLDLIAKKRLEDSVILSSFNHASINYCRQLAPEVRTGLLYAQPLHLAERYCKDCDATALHPYHRLVLFDPGLLSRCRENGIECNVWTVDDEREITELIGIGVDSIITNYPDRVAALLN